MCSQLAYAAADYPWDVEVVFDQADFGDFYPFQGIPGRTGEDYGVLLNGADDLLLFTEYCGGEGIWWKRAADKCTQLTCSEDPAASCRCNDTSTVYRMDGWFIERKPVSSDTYNLLVRGRSAPDCGEKGSSYVSGRLWVNSQRGWKITNVARCNAGDDNFGRDTFCVVEDTTLSFAAGSTCGGCCACEDGASLDINITVSKNGFPASFDSRYASGTRHDIEGLQDTQYAKHDQGSSVESSHSEEDVGELIDALMIRMIPFVAVVFGIGLVALILVGLGLILLLKEIQSRRGKK